MVTNLFASGSLDLEDVAQFLGHNDVATTRECVRHGSDRPRHVSERALELSTLRRGQLRKRDCPHRPSRRDITSEDEVSAAEAARVFDVSRQYVDRLIADGCLPFGHRPSSKHRTVRVADVGRLAAERVRRRTSTDKTITALLDGGLDY